MKRKTGIWIDRKKVLIMHMSDDYREFKEWESEVDNRERFPGEGRSFGRFGDQYLPPEKKKQAKEESSLHHLFEKLDHEVRNSQDILIMGPADIKNKLHEFLQSKSGRKYRKVLVEAADRMTNNQFKARVRESFSV